MKARSTAISPIHMVDLQAQRLRLNPSLDQAVKRVLNLGKFIMGPEVGELEEKLAVFCGAANAVSCANGTDALQLSLMAWGLQKSDAVFVPAFTFAASAEAVAVSGATPVFVDVEAHNFNMSMNSLREAINIAKSQGLKPSVIMPVDLFGQPANYEELTGIANEHHTRILCDAAQSFGGSHGEHKVGAIGDATATSFFPSKPLGCYGDGGAIFTSDDEFADRLRSLRVHGKGSGKYDNVSIGLNSRLDTIQAAILLEKMKVFQDEILARQAVADRYSVALSSDVIVPLISSGSTSAWAQYTIRVPNRDAMQTALSKRGVPSAVYYPLPLSQQVAYRHFPSTEVPCSKALAKEVLSLPMHPYLDLETQDYIIECVLDAAATNYEAQTIGSQVN